MKDWDWPLFEFDVFTFRASEHEANGDEKQADINQLQFTCKQFLRETKQLAVQYNNIKGPSYAFFRLLKCAPSSFLLLLKNVHLHGRFLHLKNPDEFDLRRLLRFAFDRPQRSITVYPDGFGNRQNLGGFMRTAGNIERALRNDNLRLPWVDKTVVDNWRRGESLAAMNAPNLRFFPVGELDRDRLRAKLVNRATTFADVVVAQYQGNVDTVMNRVEGWYRNGV